MLWEPLKLQSCPYDLYFSQNYFMGLLQQGLEWPRSGILQANTIVLVRSAKAGGGSRSHGKPGDANAAAAHVVKKIFY